MHGLTRVNSHVLAARHILITLLTCSAPNAGSCLQGQPAHVVVCGLISPMPFLHDFLLRVLGMLVPTENYTMDVGLQSHHMRLKPVLRRSFITVRVGTNYKDP